MSEKIRLQNRFRISVPQGEGDSWLIYDRKSERTYSLKDGKAKDVKTGEPLKPSVAFALLRALAITPPKKEDS